MATNTKGGFLKGIGRVFAGESLFMATYTAKQDAKIAFSSTVPGNILALDVSRSKFIIQKGAFLAAESSVTLKTTFNKKLGTGFFSGEGFILQKLSGCGTAFLEIDADDTDEVQAFVMRELERMVPSLLTEEQRELINPNKLVAFFQSKVARRMAEADVRGDLFREKPFVMDYEDVLLQGIIDVFWLEGERVVLLDYKTDRVQAAKELEDRYKTQLDLYAQALCRVFSTKERAIECTENLIYAFAFDEVLVLNPPE